MYFFIQSQTLSNAAFCQVTSYYIDLTFTQHIKGLVKDWFALHIEAHQIAPP